MSKEDMGIRKVAKEDRTSKTVEISISGPLLRHERFMGCRRCGGSATVWHIVNLISDNVCYWECEDCGLGEVVGGTPMDFGEPYLGPDEEREPFLALLHTGYIAYREKRGIPIPESWRKLVKKHEEYIKRIEKKYEKKRSE